MASNFFYDGFLSTEGDELYYKIRGKGKAIIFIAPAGGDGDGYYPIAKALSDKYKVITYDRRANTRSTMNFPDHFDIRQQSRDALSVLRAAGEESAIVVGNSSGAVIALDMSTAYPEAVHGAIVHEAAIPCVLPDIEAKKWADFFKDCYDIGKQKGASRGAMKFYFGIELPAVRLMIDTLKVYKYRKQDKISCDVKYIPSKAGSEFLLFQELLPVTSYQPDFDALKNSGVEIFIGCGEYGLAKNTWYARAAKIMANRLGCELLAFPGHHGEYMGRNYLPWANVVREAIQKMGW
ncbi:MAG: alpha/beta hydrolase [Oscillospiraceae bacterium]|nr:alpha/beta hydrolase [Oscillospiraceae bacterium]